MLSVYIRALSSTLSGGAKHSPATTMSTTATVELPEQALDDAFDAAASGNVEVLQGCQTLALAGRQTREVNPLQIAVINGHILPVKLICERLGKEAALQRTGSDGATAIHLAAMYGWS